MATLNAAGNRNAHARIRAGDVDASSDWSFSAEDGNRLLGDNGDDWQNYGKWHMGVDSMQSDDTKAHYKYPFGKGGKVYRSALAAIRQRAAQQNDDAIFAAAGECMNLMDSMMDKSAREERSTFANGWTDRDELAPAGNIIPIRGVKALDFQMEVKLAGDTGEFSGYASVFGNVDLGGDVIERGAFKEFVTTKDGMVRVLYQHDTRNPIGKARVWEDAHGLGFDGKLVLEDALARKSYAYMKAGILDGMSIGYDVLGGPGEGFEMKGDVRVLKKLKLWEISLVTFGMNPLAQVASVKHHQQITSIREYERFLRDEGGFSNAQAKLLARAWCTLPGQRDADGEGDESLKQLVDTAQIAALKFST